MTSAYRSRIHRSYGYRCFYCGKKVYEPDEAEDVQELATVDHLLPSSRGGTDSPSNLVTACQPCNCEKDDRTLEEYRRWKTVRRYGYLPEPDDRAITFHGEQ